MKHIYLFLIASALCLSASAQSALKKPLTFVSADSIVVWGEGINDLRSVAHSVDANLSAKATAKPNRSFRKNLKAWQNVWLPTLTPAGCSHPAQPAVNPTQCSRMLDMAAELFRQSGHADFMEVTERTLLNDLLHCALMSPKASMERHIAAQALIDGMGRTYATDEEGIYINLFMNSTTRIRTPHFRCVVDQLTAYPFESRLRVRLTSLPHNGYPLKIRLRRPLWACDSTVHGEKWRIVVPQKPQTCQPLVNGRDILQLDEKDGYFIIDRRWNNGDEILIELPNAPRQLVSKSSEGTAAVLRRGPLLYNVTSPHYPGIFTEKPLQEDDSDDYPVIKGLFKDGMTFTAQPYAVSFGSLWNGTELR